MPVLVRNGYCSICQRDTRFEASDEWLRDFYLCTRCGTIPRQRATVEVLNLVRPGMERSGVTREFPLHQFLRRTVRWLHVFILF
jgi:hypothetical protein